MKVSELEGVQLDYWVARAEGRTDVALDADVGPVIANDSIADPSGEWYEPSSNWAQGGPLIERERIGVAPNGAGSWSSFKVQKNDDAYICMTGPDALTAAMRTYVASKFGGEVADNPQTS
jgi:hypothetical protein